MSKLECQSYNSEASHVSSVIDGMAVIFSISYVWSMTTIVILRKKAIQPDCHIFAQIIEEIISQPAMQPVFYEWNHAAHAITSHPISI